MTTDGRAILRSTLGIFLGFDDGAEDVLDHLLTIESKGVSCPLEKNDFFVI
jgi:hypothetical protein